MVKLSQYTIYALINYYKKKKKGEFKTINEIVSIEVKYAEREKPGACHIDLPVNIA